MGSLTTLPSRSGADRAKLAWSKMDWRDLLKRAETARHAGRYHEALQLSDRAAQLGEEARYHAALIRGDTLLELGDAASALSSYESIADPFVPDPYLDCARGLALFELAKLPEAENALRSAARGRPDLAEAYFTLGLIAEMQGTGEEVELFRMARRLEPDRYPATPQRSRKAFEALVERALEQLPPDLHSAVADVPVLVAEVPHPNDLNRSHPPVSPNALGMFIGGERYVAGHGPAILLFKRNLERAFPREEQLVAELRVTVQHELMRLVGRPAGVKLD